MLPKTSFVSVRFSSIPALVTSLLQIRKGRRHHQLLWVLGMLSLATPPAIALPQGGQVTRGKATIEQANPKRLIISDYSTPVVPTVVPALFPIGQPNLGGEIGVAYHAVSGVVAAILLTHWHGWLSESPFARKP
jgi:hypothetical protein